MAEHKPFGILKKLIPVAIVVVLGIAAVLVAGAIF